MAMTNEQLVNALVSAYQRKGVQMTSLLSDPIFTNLPPAEKVEMIKKHVDTILHGSQSSWTAPEVKRVIGLTAIASGISLAPAVVGLMQNPQMWTAARVLPYRYRNLAYGISMALATGGVYFGMNNYLNAVSNVDARKALRSELQGYKHTGDESYLVGSMSNISKPGEGVVMTSLKENMKGLMPNMVHSLGNNYGAYQIKQETAAFNRLPPEQQAIIRAQRAEAQARQQALNTAQAQQQQRTQ